MTRLTVERLFSDPPLNGTLPANIRFSPKGDCLGFLRVADDDRNRQDLWRYDLVNQTARCWLDARRLMDPDASLTPAEKTERERKRQFASGITQYEFSPDGECLLFPVNGTGYLLGLESNQLNQFTQRDLTTWTRDLSYLADVKYAGAAPLR